MVESAKSVLVEIDFEYHKDEKHEGYLIDLLDQDGIAAEVFFLAATTSDIEEWICATGEEDRDFEYEREWDDSEGETGGYVAKKQIIEDSWDDNVREYLLDRRQHWKQHE